LGNFGVRVAFDRPPPAEMGRSITYNGLAVPETGHPEVERG
jgi:hypothetical protein